MKFALTHKGDIVWGPTEFNAAFLNAVLEDLGFSSVDRYINTRSATIIDEDTQTYFLPVVEILPDYNHLTTTLYKDRHEIMYQSPIIQKPTHVNFYYYPSHKPIDQIKRELKAKTSAYRNDYKEFSILYTIGEKTFSIPTDDETRLSLTIKIASGDGPYNYKFGNQWVQVTKADLQDILTKIDEKIQFSFDWQNSKINEIEDAATVDDLLKINISTPPQASKLVEEQIDDPVEEEILEKVYDSDGNVIGYQIQGNNLVSGS